MTEYKYRGSASAKGDAQLVGEELAAVMAANDGKAESADLVEYATDPDTELHKCFTWDDTACGVKHRLWEARRLIRLVVVVSTDGKTMPIAINVVVSDGDDSDQHYSTPSRIRGDVAEQIAARNAALSRLASAERGVEELAQVLGDNKSGKRAETSRKLVSRARATVEKIKPEARP